MLTKSDLSVGLVVMIPDVDGTWDEVTIIGLDPHEDKWVGSCTAWEFGVSHIEEDDYEAMRLKK